MAQLWDEKALQVDAVIEEGKFVNHQKIALYTISWAPRDRVPKGVFFVHHGLHDHCRRYAYFAQAAVNEGYAVHGRDSQGHGRSEGVCRGYVLNFSDFVRESVDFIRHTMKSYPANTPFFVIGESMGGAITFQVAIEMEKEISGAIMLAPALKIPKDIYPWLQKMAGCFAHMIPRAKIIELDGGKMSHDEIGAEDFKKDPICNHDRIRAWLAAQILWNTTKVNEQMASTRFPFLLMHGTDDVICDIEGCRELMDKSPSADKTFKEYEGMYHDLIREINKDEVNRDILDWANARSQSPETAGTSSSS